MTTRWLILCSAVLCFGWGIAQAGDSPARVLKGTKILWAPGEVKWAPMPGLAGAMQSPLWGDPDKGEHGVLYKWPAGTTVADHFHNHGDRGVVVTGTMTLAVDGAKLKELPPGSYFSLGGGVKHATACKKGADCVFFIQREGRFDAVMVEAKGKK